MLIQKVSADRLNPAAYNPRRDLKPGDKDYEKLKRSIEEFGFVEPVVWNGATGNVVGGHQRLKVLLDMGETEIDCVVVDLEPEKEKALNLALNRIQGDWDEAKLAKVIAELDASAFDVSFTGFDAEEIDALTKLGRRFIPLPLAAPAAAHFTGCAKAGRMPLLKRALSMCWTMQNAVPTKIPVILFLTRLERLYMRAAQPLLLTRCRRATACGPLQKSASETAPGTMRSRN